MARAYNMRKRRIQLNSRKWCRNDKSLSTSLSFRGIFGFMSVNMNYGTSDIHTPEDRAMSTRNLSIIPERTEHHYLHLI